MRAEAGIVNQLPDPTELLRSLLQALAVDRDISTLEINQLSRKPDETLDLQIIAVFLVRLHSPEPQRTTGRDPSKVPGLDPR